MQINGARATEVVAAETKQIAHHRKMNEFGWMDCFAWLVVLLLLLLLLQIMNDTDNIIFNYPTYYKHCGVEKIAHFMEME